MLAIESCCPCLRKRRNIKYFLLEFDLLAEKSCLPSVASVLPYIASCLGDLVFSFPAPCIAPIPVPLQGLQTPLDTSGDASVAAAQAAAAAAAGMLPQSGPVHVHIRTSKSNVLVLVDALGPS